MFLLAQIISIACAVHVTAIICSAPLHSILLDSIRELEQTTDNTWSKLMTWVRMSPMDRHPYCQDDTIIILPQLSLESASGDYCANIHALVFVSKGIQRMCVFCSTSKSNFNESCLTLTAFSLFAMFVFGWKRVLLSATIATIINIVLRLYSLLIYHLIE